MLIRRQSTCRLRSLITTIYNFSQFVSTYKSHVAYTICYDSNLELKTWTRKFLELWSWCLENRLGEVFVRVRQVYLEDDVARRNLKTIQLLTIWLKTRRHGFVNVDELFLRVEVYFCPQNMATSWE